MQGAGSIFGWGAKILHALWPKKKKKKTNIKQKQYCNKFNKDFKNGLRQKEKKNSYKKKRQNRKLVLATSPISLDILTGSMEDHREVAKMPLLRHLLSLWRTAQRKPWEGCLYCCAPAYRGQPFDKSQSVLYKQVPRDLS